jgi:hypothetical protein
MFTRLRPPGMISQIFDRMQTNTSVLNIILRPYWDHRSGAFNQAIRLSDLRRMDQSSKRVAQIIESRSYDLAYVHPCQVTQSPMILQHLKEIPTVYYLHEPPRAIYENRPVRPFYKNNGSWFRSFLNNIDPLLLTL